MIKLPVNQQTKQIPDWATTKATRIEKTLVVFWCVLFFGGFFVAMAGIAGEVLFHIKLDPLVTIGGFSMSIAVAVAGIVSLWYGIAWIFND